MKLFRFLFFLLLFACSLPLIQAQEMTDSVKYQFPMHIISATRYSEPWISVPLAISSLNRNDMPKGKGYGLDEALSTVPGVLVQSRFGNQDVRISIRGFGARGAGERSNAGTSRGVRILNNGFPETEPDGRTSFDLIDVSGAGNIEVIRSNASSLYGNASGGIINITSNTMFESPYASYNESFGSFGFRKEMINAGAMLGSGKMYFSLSNTNWDGWRAQSQSSQLLLNTGIISQVGERTNLGVHISGTSNIFRIPGPLSIDQYNASAEQSDSLYRARDERRYNRLGRIGLTLDHQVSDENTISATAFAQPKVIQRSERNTFRDFNRYHVGGSLMFRNRMSSSAMHNNFIAGIDEAYQDGAILFYNLTPESFRGTLRDNKREGANNFGAFLQDELALGENLIFLGGLRYDNISYYSEGYLDPPSSRLGETKSFEKVTPKLGITYRLSAMQSFYANYGGGIEVPAGNETDPSGTVPGDNVHAINPLLEPIRSKTFEVGTKQMLPLGDDIAYLTYDVAAYWLEVTDDIIPYRNGRFYFTAGRTERMGLEIGGALRFTNGLSANVAVTASSNKYKEYRVDSVHYSASKAGLFADYADNKVVGVPDLFFNIGLKYTFKELKNAYIKADLQNVGSYYADDANIVEVPSYSIINAGLGVDNLNFADDKMFLNLFLGLNNLTDTKYIGSAWLNPDYINGKPVYIEPGLPSNFIGSIGLGMNF